MALTTTKKLVYSTLTLSVIITLISVLRVALTPTPEGKTLEHYLFESIVGPLGATFSFFAFLLIYLVGRSMGGVMGRGLKFFSVAMIFVFFGMVAFGIHGYNIFIGTTELLPGDVTRLILRSCVLIAGFFMFIGSYIIGKETLD
ncbi:MAG: hypothetical protein ACW981_02430 [Candidatus Hodarchaeales archaeon]|jgi:hypothetical protein